MCNSGKVYLIKKKLITQFISLKKCILFSTLQYKHG